MAMQVVWKAQAMNEVRKVILYGQENFGERAATILYDQIRVCADRLSFYPQLGMIEKLLRNRKHIYRSFVVHRHYKLIYYIEKDTVYIADLWDTRREPVRLSGRVKR